MSQENVEIVRSQVERFRTTGEASPETAAEDISWHDPPDFPDAQIHVGMEGAIHALGVWASAWSEWQIELNEYIDAGERVLVRGTQRGRGKDTGVVVEQPLCLVYLLRGGKVVEVRAFFNEDQALEAAGLAE
jgi:ketosteroid isomerase-like protein